MAKKLKDLVSLKPKPPAPLPETILEESSDSELEKEPSKKARRAAATFARKKRDKHLSDTALKSITSAPRKKRREAALDLHRRQQKAQSLRPGADTPAVEAWPSFFVIANSCSDDTVVVNSSSGSQASASGTASCGPSRLPQSNGEEPCASPSIISDLSRPCTVSGPPLSGFVQRHGRNRPSRESSKLTAASTRAAVGSLLG